MKMLVENQIRPRRYSRLAVCAFAVAVLLGAWNVDAAAAEAREGALVTDGVDGGRMKLLTGRSTILQTNRPYKRVSIADPEVALVKPVGVQTVLLIPKKAGLTQLILWDDNERSQMIDVLVQADLQVLQEQFKTLLPDSKIEVTNANGAVVLRGQVPSAQSAEQAVALATPYSPKVLNMLEVSGGQQVMLQVRFAEVSRSASSALGVNLFAADGSFVGGSNIGQVSPITALPKGRVGVAPAPRGTTIEQGHSISPNVTLFGAGQIGSFYLEALVQALRQNNLLRILAEPNLLAMSGQEASFLAGGSFPIPVAGGAAVGGTTSVTVEFREFGIRLNMTPTVLGGGRIRLKVAPEVSELDFSAAVRVNAFLIPGLTQRRVQTTVELAEGQTFCIAGLLSQNVSAQKDVAPLLGDLPVVGTLFRSVRYQRKETELVVLVTPRLAEPMNPGQVPAVPGQNWRHPSEADLFLKQDLGGPVPAGNRPTTQPAGKPPRFYGQYGFVPVGAKDAK